MTASCVPSRVVSLYHQVLLNQSADGRPGSVLTAKIWLQRGEKNKLIKTVKGVERKFIMTERRGKRELALGSWTLLVMMKVMTRRKRTE